MIKNNIQDFVLNHARKEKMEITIYLSNGVPLKGKVISFDNFTIVMIGHDGKQSLIYKHAITTVTPSKPIRFHIPEEDESGEETNE
ncbi:MAG: RNA chaperone Hfq [Spirochaetia bacterium]|nr:RNA chaperone Hfq [Spirochaetia bacterium]